MHPPGAGRATQLEFLREHVGVAARLHARPWRWWGAARARIAARRRGPEALRRALGESGGGESGGGGRSSEGKASSVEDASHGSAPRMRTDHGDRVAHAAGKGYPRPGASARGRTGGGAPDGVLYPDSA